MCPGSRGCHCQGCPPQQCLMDRQPCQRMSGGGIRSRGRVGQGEKKKDQAPFKNLLCSKRILEPCFLKVSTYLFWLFPYLTVKSRSSQRQLLLLAIRHCVHMARAVATTSFSPSQWPHQNPGTSHSGPCPQWAQSEGCRNH